MKKTLEELKGDGMYNPVKEIDFTKLKKVPTGSIEEKLYDIIDNIDTAYDIFRPEMKSFEHYVSKQISSKNRLIISDGYDLFYFSDDDASYKEAEHETVAPKNSPT